MVGLARFQASDQYHLEKIQSRTPPFIESALIGAAIPRALPDHPRASFAKRLNNGPTALIVSSVEDVGDHDDNRGRRVHLAMDGGVGSTRKMPIMLIELCDALKHQSDYRLLDSRGYIVTTNFGES
jgi:hypothetical protein